MKVVEYLKETKAELKHVSWPTRQQAVAFSAIVIVVSIAVALLLGLLDLIFTQIISTFLM